MSEYTKEYYKKNREKILKRNKDYYNSPHGKVKKIESVKKYKAKHVGKFKKYAEEYRSKPENKDRLKHLNLIRRYRISLDEYQSMYDKQNGLCEVCCTSSERLLAVDHNHKTGRIRGLLCSQCNLAIGNSKEDVKILKNMIKYINKHNNP